MYNYDVHKLEIGIFMYKYCNGLLPKTFYYFFEHDLIFITIQQGIAMIANKPETKKQ